MTLEPETDSPTAAAAVLRAALLFAAALYDSARLVTARQPLLPPLARLRGRRAALEAEERWCAGLLLHGPIDARPYRQRMSGLARVAPRRAAPPVRRSSRHCY
ncbi:hypothetical protein [Streptomyces sp. NPDC002588]|uniref:hypothetical protein n=1 Tax=Streptomyces sp. NPDC002588 TaxID=3154419 RepID=UPI003321FF66